MSKTGHGKSTTKETGSHWQFVSDSDARTCSACGVETFVTFDRKDVHLCAECVDQLVSYVEA